MNYVKPKKSLGQHFLADHNIARKIVTSLEAKNVSTILEIGPGMGVLTKYLLENKDYTTYVIEIDKESVEYLRSNYPQLDKKIIERDFLKIKLQDYFSSPICLIGNLPYNISSQIFFRIIEQRDMVNETVCMIQKEVADRILSPHGNKNYGILSVFMQCYFTISRLFNVKPNVFIPPPKVDSTVLSIKRNERKELGCDDGMFVRIVKATFNQRRKTIRNSLKSIFLTLPEENIFFIKRPEQLCVDDFIQLTIDLENYTLKG
ncbi:MAG: 16S rRNA (adenine(1518)-N(6)/adenine(1519)-N(6))-dimethyltransferase RsmA [Bacteroidales bacterium]|nr:16S rRNA (adenine(1518)-N(6)/adenine(1519)-N(6))-dimethyltransferase RsmA [Bacteroidales bacterium]